MGKILQNRIGIYLLGCVLLTLFIVSTSALKTFSQSEGAQLCHAVRNGDGIPPSAVCNISIYYSNGTNLVNFSAMSDFNDRYCYPLNVTQTSVKGIYDYQVTCTDSVDNGTIDSQYLVNLGGIEPSSERTNALSKVIIIFFALALLSFVSIFFMKNLPLKVMLFLFAIWFMLMGINSTFISIQDEVVNTNIEQFFSFFLVISYWANFFIFGGIIIIAAITLFVNMIERKKVNVLKDYG